MLRSEVDPLPCPSSFGKAREDPLFDWSGGPGQAPRRAGHSTKYMSTRAVPVYSSPGMVYRQGQLESSPTLVPPVPQRYELTGGREIH